jgi:hypothetical protein
MQFKMRDDDFFIEVASFLISESVIHKRMKLQVMRIPFSQANFSFHVLVDKLRVLWFYYSIVM